MIAATIALASLLTGAPTCEGEWEDGFRSSKEVRQDTKRRIDDTARRMGASAYARRVLATMASRESSNDPCSVHTRGVGEYGLGPFGLSVRWTLGIWDRDAPEEVLMIPEVATVVALRIYRRAVSRHGATTWREVNAVFALGKNKARKVADHNWCHRMKMRGLDCEDDPRGHLGKVMGVMPTEGQEEWIDVEQ